MTTQLVCWRCGEPLQKLPRRIPGFAECSQCRADLHVCLLCRHYAPRYIGQCSHDRAERVVDKRKSNFCTYFRPRPNAHLPPNESIEEETRARLDALFGETVPDTENSDESPVTEQPEQISAAMFDLETEPVIDEMTAEEKARQELSALFGDEPAAAFAERIAHEPEGPAEQVADSIVVVVLTQRLVVRHFKTADCVAMESVFCDEEVMAFSEGVKTKQWVHEWVQSCPVNYYRPWGYGPWALAEKRSGNTIGYCGLIRFPDVRGQVEIEVGYRLARASWGNGYATEAVLAVLGHAFHTLGIKRLIALIDPGNVRSTRVAETVGMRYDGEVLFDGYDHPDHVYAMSRDDWVLSH